MESKIMHTTSVKLLLCVAVLAACPETRAEARTKETRTAADTESASPSIQRELSKFPAIESGKVDVSIHSGRAVLSGNVSTLLAKEQIASAVGGLDGVYFVRNRIRVFAGNRRDIEIRKDIQKGLVFNPVTEEFELSVEVHDGHVTLTGVVDSRKEADAAEKVAKSTPGARSVANELIIQPK